MRNILTYIKENLFVSVFMLFLGIAVLGACGLLVFAIVQGVQYDKEHPPTRVEREHLYYKDIEVEVVSIDYRHWYASGHHYVCDIKVRSNEYDIEKSFSLIGYEAKEFENVKKGDIITATLSSWKIDSTGEITRREITNIN